MGWKIDLKKAKKIASTKGLMRALADTKVMWTYDYHYLSGATLDPALQVDNNGTFTFNRDDAYTIPNVLHGFGVYKSIGKNVITLTGTSDMKGMLDVQFGRVIIDKTIGSPLISLGGINYPMTSTSVEFDCNVSTTQVIPSITVVPYLSVFNLYAEVILNAGSALPAGVPVLDTTAILKGSLPIKFTGKNTCGHTGNQNLKVVVNDGGSTIPSFKNALILDGFGYPITVRWGGANSTTANNFIGWCTIIGNVTTSNNSDITNDAAHQNLGFKNNRVVMQDEFSKWTLNNGAETCAGLQGSGEIRFEGGTVANDIALTLDVPSNASGLNYTGKIMGSLTYHIRKTGAGTQTLSGDGDWLNTIIDGGTVVAGTATAMGFGDIIVNPGGTFNKNGLPIQNYIINNGGTVIP